MQRNVFVEMKILDEGSVHIFKAGPTCLLRQLVQKRFTARSHGTK